ncbi:MAG TPA: hypothetical protein VH478_11485 [Trebonia sp.]|nr:hypothetical protein [Trebonia sp.]
MSDGVSAWGDNSNGQLGQGDTTGVAAPTPVKGLGTVRKVAAGSGHVVALLADGTALSWGRNAFGQLGDGTMNNQLHPVPVKGLAGIKDIIPGGGQTLFLLEDGTVWGAGAGFFGLLGPQNLGLCPVAVQVTDISGVTELTSGGGHALALRADGSLWTWGRDDYGQLGDGPNPENVPGRKMMNHSERSYWSRPLPTPVSGVTGEIAALAAGGGHSTVILKDGTMLSWGDNDRGQLGDGTMDHRSSPGPVPGVTDVVAAACAYHHTLALRQDGTVLAFGINDRGQLGDGTTEHRPSAVPVKGLADVVAVTCAGGGGEADPGNFGSSMALLRDGTVMAWGCNDHGQLGDGGTNRGRLVPAPVPGLSGIAQITSGGEIPFSRENPGGGYALAVAAASIA